ncbi:calcineurin B homologous protein 2 [Drosophila innubila]|uniref:calcineurin B homologous protein 2 n=1 Tax=Drosophila innubila TaxID=198719 RepID=UPI00148B34EC|nr:calcineurin B homologous protein 2 [Drosophila innubila]
MGQMQSHQLSAVELQAHQEATGLSIEQLEELHVRFLALDRRQRGYLTPTELLRIPQLSQNPLHRQIIDGFFGDTNSNCRDRINFGQFVGTCATFLVPQCTSHQQQHQHQRVDGRAQKLRLLSKMFDTQRCGHIERTDFRKVMMSLLDGAPPSDGVANVYPHSSEQELQLLEQLAFGARQSISYEQFEQRISTANIESKLAIHKWLQQDEEPQQETETETETEEQSSSPATT